MTLPDNALPLQDLLARAQTALAAEGAWLALPGPQGPVILSSHEHGSTACASLRIAFDTLDARARESPDQPFALTADSLPSTLAAWGSAAIAPVAKRNGASLGWIAVRRKAPFTAQDLAIAQNFAGLAAGRLVAPPRKPVVPAKPVPPPAIGQPAPRKRVSRAHSAKAEATPGEQLARAMALLDAVVEATPGAFLLLDSGGHLLRWNKNLETHVGYKSDRLLGLAIGELVTQEDRLTVDQGLIDLVAQGEPVAIETHVRHADGKVVPYQLFAQRIDVVDECYVLVIARDISERRRAEKATREAKTKLDLAMSSSGLALWDWDIARQRVYFNEGFARLIGNSAPMDTDVTAEKVITWVHADDQRTFRRAFDSAVARASGEFECEYRLLGPNGPVWVLSRGRVTERDAAGNAERMLGTSMNINERRQAEERAEYLATRDALTGLPNRVLLADRLEQGIVTAARNKGSLAFMFIDLDRFKTINDSLGHAVGDELLKRVATRMQACVRASDTVARLGGDEFAVILSELSAGDQEGAQAVAEKIVAALAMPMLVDSHHLNTSCSIGVALFPMDGRDSATLMRNADVAMYHAKEKGRNNYQFFSADMNARAQERLATENFLRLALRRNELLLMYQPRLSMQTGEVVGAEALLRWQHPRRGLLRPDAFISVAEEAGMIVSIGEWVLETACAQVALWRKTSPQFQLSLNLSVEQVRDGERLYGGVANALRAAGLPGQALELELTESILMQSVKEKVTLLNRLGELGVSLAIDDFGTGYSSLSYLKQLPVDTIKIDASFVRDLVDDANDHAIVQAILAMAKNLSLQTVAEGVETQAQLDQLKAMGCDEYQGYLVSQAVVASEFEARFF